MSRKAWSAAFFVVILTAIWLPRAVALDRVVTPDEHIWLARSANFYYALAHMDPGGTLQFVHPGVTVMWVGAMAYAVDYFDYFRDAPGQLHQWSVSPLRAVLTAHGHTPIELLVATRFAMVITHTLILGVAFLQAIKLLGRGPATIGMLLIAFSPFQIALGQLLHVDAMTGNVMFLSALALLNFRFRGGGRRDLLISGVAAGLAWLTRSPALFLLPYAGLVMLTGLSGDWKCRNRIDLRSGWSIARPYLGWIGLGLATFTLFWPAMWVRPLEIGRIMYLVTFKMAAEGHDLPLFYAGRIVTGDPGILFYPVTYLWRTTPVSLIGLLLAAVALAWPAPALLRSKARGPLVMLVLFGILFTVFMGFGAKKFDRYLLPAYPPLDLVAGAGWFAAATWFHRQRHLALRLAAPVILIVAISGQLISAGLAHPYYLGYYNPLVGGARAAEETMMVGWGEGLDQVAHYLNRQPDAEDIQVLSRVWPSTLAYFLDGDLVLTRFAPEMHTVAAWLSSDYYVLYVTEMQRGMIPRQVMRYFTNREPVMVANVQDVPYAYVYDLRSAPLPSSLVANDPCATDFGDDIRFLAYWWGEEPARPTAKRHVTVYFQARQPVERTMRVRLRLLTDDGRLIAADEATLRPMSSAGTMQPLDFRFKLPVGTSPNSTRFSVTISDPTTGTALQARDLQTGRPHGRTARPRC